MFCVSQQSPAKTKFWKMKIYGKNYKLLYMLASCCFSWIFFLFLHNKNEESSSFQALFWPFLAFEAHQNTFYLIQL